MLGAYLPLMTAAVLVVSLIAAAAVVVLFIRTSELTRRQQAEADTMRALSAQTASTTMERIEALSRQMLAADSDLKSTQSAHFVNFLGLIDSGSQAQERRLAQMNETVQNAVSGLRASLDKELAAMRQTNEKALESMRNTVDEKLSATLNTRLTESFKTVEGQLLEVHRGLGEMRRMAQNVDGLRRVLTNVKTRGTFGEVQLGMILSDLLTPEQYDTNVATRPGSRDRVEFAVRLPAAEPGSHVLLPIDAKFPGDTYAHLQAAQQRGDAAAVNAMRKALNNVLRAEAKDIHDKYIEVPYTTSFGILFLPFEGLYAEVVSSGVTELLQREYQITVAGPSTMAALLNALQMGFRTLAIQKRSGEVWTILGAVKTEFEKFGTGLQQMQRHLNQTGSDLEELIGPRSRAITRKLESVQQLDPDTATALLGIEE